MMLRESSNKIGESFELQTEMYGSATRTNGIPHAQILVAFPETVVGMEEIALTNSRMRLLSAPVSDALVDTAGVESHQL